jgi:hypothetical protein
VALRSAGWMGLSVRRGSSGAASQSAVSPT